MKWRGVLLVLFAAAPPTLSAQGVPLAALGGRVTAEGGTPLSGVRVTVRSANLQAQRETLTMITGEYFLPFLPPGDYVVRISLAGMQEVARTAILSAAVDARLDVEMRPAPAEESVTVSADALVGTPLDTTEVASSYKRKLVDQLPVDRSLRSVALLAPGVTDNGPTGNIGSANTRPALVISGAQSFESLFLIDGVVVNENLRGQPQDLFVEDAIEETTVLTGSISSEYGRFTGGVVNAVTRSGGNAFHGSFRTSFTNDDWTAADPYLERTFGRDDRVDQLNEAYEATLGGAIWKDRIWFFGAGRQERLTDSRETTIVPHTDSGDVDAMPVPYLHTFEEYRVEGKLTGNLTPSHNVVAQYTAVRPTETNGSYFNPGDTGVLDDVQTPQNGLALNYNGVFSSTFFAEAQYSRRTFHVEGTGAGNTDFIRGTRVDVDAREFTLHVPAGLESSPENYGNTSGLIKGSFLLATETLGTHDLRVGGEWFSKQMVFNAHFSASDFVVSNADAIVRGSQVFPVFRNQGSQAVLEWWPIATASLGDEFVTQSAFFNDGLRLGARWSFNLGVRYDRNQAKDSQGRPVSTSAAWSPRLGAQFDASGNGTILLSGGYARYVAGLHEGIVQLFSGAGQPSSYTWNYAGPCVNCDLSAPTSDLLTTPEALAQVDAWFQSIGGIAAQASSSRIAGVNRLVPIDGLVSPSATEYTLGLGAALGSRGWARVDFLYRNYDNFYDDRIDTTTGTVTAPSGEILDIDILENSRTLDRRYEAAQLRIDYRFSATLYAGGSYTWSRLTGNVVGENENVSAAPEHVGRYPEYQRASWADPTGYLPGDQRHRMRIWFGSNVPLSFGQLGATLLESYSSGLPYEATGDVAVGQYVDNPGYHPAPETATYFFSPRGAFRTGGVSSTDLALTLTIRAFETVDLFVQPQVLNLFNQKGVVAVDTPPVRTALDDPEHLRAFNPLTEKPVRGVNYELAEGFGQPIAYQLPRTFRVSVGLRF